MKMVPTISIDTGTRYLLVFILVTGIHSVDMVGVLDHQHPVPYIQYPVFLLY